MSVVVRSLLVVGCLTLTLATANAQKPGGYSVTGEVAVRGAEHRTSFIDSTLAILDNGTYVAAGYIGCGRAQYCEPGTWSRGKRGQIVLQPSFPPEWDPPQQLTLTRCFYNNSFLTSSTNKPKVARYRHILQAGDASLFTIKTSAKVSARFVFGRTSVRAKGVLSATPLPLDDAVSILRDGDCDPADYAPTAADGGN